jgi:nitroreductase
MDALAAIADRHSTRRFAPRAVDRSIIQQIVDAGRRAATARNEQPWEFIIVTDPAMRRRIADLSEFGKFIADAPACIVVLCKDTKYYLEDGCAASQNILVAAAALGVQSCWVAGDKKPYAPAIVQLLAAPPNMKLISLLAIGYAAQADPLKAKRPLEEVLHWERF